MNYANYSNNNKKARMICGLHKYSSICLDKIQKKVPIPH